MTEAALGGGMDSLLAKMEEGAAGAEGQLDNLGAVSLEALLMLTAKNDEQASQAESGFRQQMSGIKTGATATFGNLTSKQIDKATTAMTEGTASMDAAVTGFDTSLNTIYEKVDAAIRQSLEELDGDLGQKLAGLDAQIVSEAWKAAEKEQPAWKSVVAIILVIVVIIAAAVISIVTLGAGASLFAIILVGALVGAVSAGLIQIINNWASGEEWHQGVVQAMVIGAIGGAIGGGLGFAGGALAAGAAAGGARVATQLAITVGSDLVAEGLTQTFAYAAFGQEFNWQGFVTAGVMSGVSFRAAPGGARPRGAAGGAPAPAPRTGGSAGGRRAATTQIAGGAAVGLGLEVATSAITGEKFDATRAVSTAASAAVSARASRRTPSAPTTSSTRPRGRLGRAADSVRSFDPGGVGQRLGSRLEGLGGRLAGNGGTAPTSPGRAAAGAASADGSSVPRRDADVPESAVDIPTGRRPAAESPESGPLRRQEHPDAPEIEPGTGLVARVPIGEGHAVSVTRDGRITVCSSCSELAWKFGPELQASPGHAQRLVQIEAIANPNAKARAAAELHAELIGLRDMMNLAGGGTVLTGDHAGLVPRMRALAQTAGIPESTVSGHVQHIIRTGELPPTVRPESPYGQRLLGLAEDIVGPSTVRQGADTPPEIGQMAAPTPESITRAKARADEHVRQSLESDAGDVAQAREQAGSEGPHLRTAREVAADALNPTGDATRRNRLGEKKLNVTETPKGGTPENLFVRGLDTYESIVQRARRISERLGMPQSEADVLMARAIIEFFQSGRTPGGLTGHNPQQRADMRFFAQLERLMLTTETIRSPTNLADVAQVLRAISEGRLPLSALSDEFPAGLASRKGNAEEGITPRKGGSPGTRRALERAEGAERRENATDRSADEVLARHGRLAENDLIVQRAGSEQALIQAFVQDIINILFGGQG